MFLIKGFGDFEMASGNKTKKRNAEEANYEFTEQDRVVLQNLAQKLKASSARIKVTRDGGVPAIGVDHPNKIVGQAHLMEALSTADHDFMHGVLSQLTNAGLQGGGVDDKGVNFMLSVIKGIAPRDQVETMLAAQMAAVHMATMTFAHRLAHVENIPQQDSAERAFNKLTRTFATQMEALKRYRTGGEQKVTVQHVSVSEGGQAIVGNVTQAPRENAPDNQGEATPALTHAKTTPMPIIGKNKEPAPVPARRRRDK
jgi:hypothetical protein